MRGKITPSSLARKTIAFYLKRLAQERDAILHHDDIEHVHKMRVATRRLRAALDVFSVALPAGIARTSEKKIAKIGKLLGRARELDVQMRFLKTLAADKERNRLIKHLKGERKNEQKKIVGRLTGLDIKRKLPGLWAWLHQDAAQDDIRHALAFRGHAKKIISQRAAKLLFLAPYARMPKRIKELHRLRIAAKKLRYTLELLRPWYGPRIRGYIHGYIRASRSIQDVLGDLHELDVLAVAIQKFSPKTNALASTCAQRRKNTYNRFIRIWKRLEKISVWEMLRRTF